MTEPVWVSADFIQDLHAAITERAGYPMSLKDRGALESACDRPRNLYLYDDERDVFSLAVHLMMAIARNHPFTDGNKRAAFMATIAFLHANGYETALPDDESFAELFENAIARAVDPVELVAVLRAHSHETLEGRIG